MKNSQKPAEALTGLRAIQKDAGVRHAAISVVALLGLFSGMSSQATDVSRQPILGGGLVEPNLVFAIDDSGSMDGELLLRTDGGALYWHRTRRSAWNGTEPQGPAGAVGGAPGTRQYRKLFPQMVNGQHAGIEDLDDQLAEAAPPIRELGWVRSSRYNPIYYDPMVEYKAWGPQQNASGVETTYGDASPTAALTHPTRSLHPNPTSPLTLDLTVNQPHHFVGNTAIDGYFFQFNEGMRFPAGARNVYNQPLTAGALANSADIYVSLRYYPATYWWWSADTNLCSSAPTVTSGSAIAISASLPEDCIDAPEGGGKLKRYEIRTGTIFPSGRTYEAEMQNFANWWQYHRKRKLMLAAAMSETLNKLPDGLRVATRVYNGSNPNNIEMLSTTTTFRPDGTVDNNGAAVRKKLVGRFAELSVAGPTPTKEVLKTIGEKFDTQAGVIQYACQRNSAFVMTDGFPTLQNLGNPPFNSTVQRATYGGQPPYSPANIGSISDWALYFYSKQLRASGANALPAGKVPVGDASQPGADLNPNLHMNTYVVTLGVHGNKWPSLSDNNNLPNSPVDWAGVTIAGESRDALDDIWHATINGRGRMLLSNSATSVSAAISQVLYDMAGKTGSQSAALITSINLSNSDVSYLARFTPGRWSGDFTKNAINPATGVITTATNLWSAADKLERMAVSDRVLVTQGGEFNAAALGGVPAAAFPPGVAASDVAEYLRGERNKEGFNPGQLRQREKVDASVPQKKGRFGAVVGSTPVFNAAKSVAFVAANDGFLHAINLKTVDPALEGKELWAYAPRGALEEMVRSSDRNWGFKTMHDGAPLVTRVGGKEMLFGSLGAGGNQWYGIDIDAADQPLSADQRATKILWELPSAADAEGLKPLMGQAVGKPLVVKTRSGQELVLLTSGYNAAAADGKGRLFVRKAIDGALVKTLETPATPSVVDAGLAHVNAFKEPDGTVRFVYGGDLSGNLWRFDLDNLDSAAAVKKVAAFGSAQPFTAKPALVLYKGKRIVLVGTGRILGRSDFVAPSQATTQTFYAIKDDEAITQTLSRTDLSPQTLNADYTITNTAFSWDSDHGWRMDLPAGQQVTLEPQVGINAVSFVTNVASADDLCGLNAYRYGLQIVSAAPPRPDDPYVGVPLPGGGAVSNQLVVTTDGQVVSLSGDANGGYTPGLFEKPGSLKAGKAGWRQVTR